MDLNKLYKEIEEAEVSLNAKRLKYIKEALAENNGIIKLRDTDRACRRCSECGRLMRKGYCIDAGAAYYCSDECLHTDFTDEEWAEEYESNDQSYYTEWE